jgi:membrane-bound ClpP family serine protease
MFMAWLIGGAVLMLLELVVPGGIVFFLGLGAMLVALFVQLGLLDGWMQAFRFSRPRSKRVKPMKIWMPTIRSWKYASGFRQRARDASVSGTVPGRRAIIMRTGIWRKEAGCASCSAITWCGWSKSWIKE